MPAAEIPFFEDPDYVHSDIVSFEELFELGYGRKAVGLKRPSYLHKPECPERIAKHIPDAKLIVVLRDPVERAMSAYYHYVLMGFVPVKHINEGLAEIINGRYAEEYPRSREIIEFGYYFKHLSRYLECFAREQTLIVLQEDIKKNPQGCVKEILRFLSVDENYVPHLLNSNPMRGVYSLPRLRFLTLRNPFAYTYDDDRMRLKKRKSGSVSAWGVAAAIYLLDRAVLKPIYGNPKPVLSGDLMKSLSHIYEEDSANLAELLRRNLQHWKVFSAIV